MFFFYYLSGTIWCDTDATVVTISPTVTMTKFKTAKIDLTPKTNTSHGAWDAYGASVGCTMKGTYPSNDLQFISTCTGPACTMELGPLEPSGDWFHLSDIEMDRITTHGHVIYGDGDHYTGIRKPFFFYPTFTKTRKLRER